MTNQTKRLVIGGLFMVFCSALWAGAAPKVRPASEMQGDCTDWIKKVADWQLAQSNWNTSRDWHWGALFAGMMAAYEATKDEEYLNKSRQWAEKYTWRMGSDSRHADNQACTQAYLEMYLLDQPDPVRYQHFQYVANLMVNDPKHFYCTSSPNSSNYWWWCDALFMAPPSFVRLSHITGDPNYINTMHWMWEETQDCLYDTEQRLFFRDTGYFDDLIGGQEVFWARGNGWVVGGIVRVLQYLPQDDPRRSRYVTLLEEMAAKLAEIQMPDGYWYSNLLYPQQFNVPETSGTGFFCYGIAWGINNGLLDRAVYGPVVEKAWNALKAAVHPNGKLGWVQPVGAGPNMSYYDSTPEVYGIGAFLLAGSEMNKYFRANDALRIDDFENYNSTGTFVPTLAGAWQDGTLNGTGARIDLGNYGDNCMELEYDNTAAPYTSCVERQFSPVKNFAVSNAAYLSILFQGFAGNTPQAFYVQVEDENGSAAVQRMADPGLSSTNWNEMAFPLSGFTGVDLSKIKYLRLGVGQADPVAGGTGLLRIDNIVLSKVACGTNLQGDFSGDCQVNLEDFAILAAQWQERYFTPAVPTDPGTANLTAYWPLDENFEDATGHGYNGTPVNTPTLAAGHIGQAGSFSGTNYLNCQNSAGVTLATGGTISAWIKTNGLTDQWASIVTKGLTSWRLIRNNTTSGVSFHFNYATGEYQANGSTNIVDNQWHHLAAVYDGTDIRLFLDGKPEASAPAPQPVRQNTDPVFIACRSDRATTYGRNWIGQIDEVRIYDRPITETELYFLSEIEPSAQVPDPRPTDLVTDGIIDHQDLTAFVQLWCDNNFWP